MKHLGLLYTLLFVLISSTEVVFLRALFHSGVEILPWVVQSLVAAQLWLTVLLGGTFWPEMRKLMRRSWQQVAAIFGVNVLHSGVAGYLYSLGIEATTATNTALITRVSVITTALLAWPLLGERFTKIKSALLAPMLFGTLLIVTDGERIVPHRGDLYLFGTILCWSFSAVMTKRFIREWRISPDLIALLRAGPGALVLGLLLLASSPAEVLLSSPLPTQYSHSLVLLEGAIIAGAWFAMNRALQHSPASYVAMLSMGTPVVVAALATTFLHEKLSSVELIGAAMIIIGGILTHRADSGTSQKA